MSSVNKAIIVGGVGKDPETRTFQNGGKVCSFSVATSERWKDKATGEQKERTEWHMVSVMQEHLATFAETYIKKGSKVYIEGQLETRKWTDKDGHDRYSTEIVLRPYKGEIRLLDGPKKSEAVWDSASQSHSSPSPELLDDEIPF
jgi:single-strand DNA-binding protein